MKKKYYTYIRCSSQDRFSRSGEITEDEWRKSLEEEFFTTIMQAFRDFERLKIVESVKRGKAFAKMVRESMK